MSYFVSFERLGNRGRLGNQLFQVALVLCYAQRTGKQAIFKQWYCDRDQLDYSEYFENKITIVKELPHFHRTWSETGYAFTEVPNLPGNVNLFGYFQSEQHFAQSEDLVRYYFTPSKALESLLRTRWHDALLKEACAIHIRRTDYLNSPHIYPVPTMEYYHKAIEYIKRETDVKRFIVFGDDITWMKANFKGNDFLFSYKQSSIQDLFLQSFCAHNIIANSSFSWWASYLNKNMDKVVIAPSKWLLNDNDRDVYRKEMIVM